MAAPPNKQYTLFWIPVRKLPFKNDCVRDSSEFNLPDPGFFSNNGQLFLYIDKYEENKFRVSISDYESTSYDAEESTIDIIELELIEYDQYGFVEFAINYIDKGKLDYPFEAVWHSISIQIYRVVKSIFHTHKYHLTKDYFIDAPLPFSSSRILTEPDEVSNYHRFYFDYILNKVEGYRRFLLSRIEDLFTLENQFRFLKFGMNDLLFIRRYVDNITGVFSYIENLKDLDDPFHKKICRYSEDIYRVRREVVDTYSAKRSNASVLLGILGLLIGLTSFGTSFVWSSRTSGDQVRLETKIDNTSRTNNALISSKFDEINVLNGEVKHTLDSLLKTEHSVCIDTIIYRKNELSIIFKDSISHH